MAELAIIADDLTGALDAAAPFAMRGIATAVALGAAGLPEAIATEARVVGVSTDSRELSPSDAREATRAAVAAVPGGTRIFKKVDSRLKGNIAAELDAIPHARSLVVPAIPAFGRWMRQGKLDGFGVSEPIDIAVRLGGHAAAATIPDIDSQMDIDRVLATAAFDLPIGARGLAEAMAKVMAPKAIVPDAALPRGPAYCIIGSTDPITLAQVERLQASDADIAYIVAPNGRASTLTSDAPLTIVHATPGSHRADSKSVARALGETVARLAPPAGSLLVLSGGATAQTILDTLGVTVLHLIGEALPGLPLARAHGLTVITKSGGFGEPDTLQRLLTPYYSRQEHIA